MKTQNNLKVIIGLGKTGLACAHFFARQGIPFAVTDSRDNPPGLTEIQQQYPEVIVKVGGLDAKLLNQAEELIVSPGVSLKHPLIAACIERGVTAIGDIELFARLAKAPICAITGSNAKSTVTDLVTAMAKKASLNVRMGGNIGTPVLELLQDQEPDLYVIEVSSFQLETTHSLKAEVATILNISPDHMDRYDQLTDYIQAKQRIYQQANFIVFNRSDKNTWPQYKPLTKQLSFALTKAKDEEFGISKEAKEFYLCFGAEKLMAVKDIPLRGKHQWENALAALALGYALKLPLDAMLQALMEFKTLAHRCEFITEKNSVLWFNDSKGTNVGATIAAIEGIGSSIDGKIVLIAGGQGKGADFSQLQIPLAHYVKSVILIGEDATLIANIVPEEVQIIFANNMQDAVAQALIASQASDAVLLSPACASFDMFANFEARGEAFLKAVQEQLS